MFLKSILLNCQNLNSIQYNITNHVLCLKTSSALLRIREPSGAEGLPTVPLNLFDNNLKTSATLAADELRRVRISCEKNTFQMSTQKTAQIIVETNSTITKIIRTNIPIFICNAYSEIEKKCKLRTYRQPSGGRYLFKLYKVVLIFLSRRRQL